MQFIDLHCHILAGLDDGAAETEDSVQMAEVAKSGLTGGIVCTPHRLPNCPYSMEELKETFLGLSALLKKNNNNIALFPGQEILISETVIPIVNGLEKGSILTINGSRYPLVEFDFGVSPDFAFRAISTLVAHGFTPIIAHPERYGFIAEIPDSAWELHELGALLQINKGSPAGVFGSDAERVAGIMLSERIADFVASDAHSPYVRTPFLREAHEWISENFSIDYADHLLHKNPLRVIKNETVHPYR